MGSRRIKRCYSYFPHDIKRMVCDENGSPIWFEMLKRKSKSFRNKKEDRKKKRRLDEDATKF